MTNSTDEINNAEMPFLDHIRELRSRMFVSMMALAIGFVVAYCTYSSYISYIIAPFTDALSELGHDPEMVTRGLTEAFMTKIQFSFYAAIALTFPIHLYEFIAFIMPALTRKERRVLGAGLSAGSGLFMMGICMAYFMVLPLSIRFFLGLDLVPDGTKVQIDFQRNLLFAGKMIMAFAILFQLPLVLVVLMAFNIVKRKTLLSCSRYVIVLIFLLSAILTPPDVVSQVALAIPLIVLFFISILVAKIFGFGNSD